jgi:hypothetical protein
LKLAYGVPILAPAGDRDRPRNIGPHVEAGALWMPLIQWDTEHHRLDNHMDYAFFYDWLRWVINERVPQEVPGNAIPQLNALDASSGWYAAGDTIGAGTTADRFNWVSLTITAAADGMPANAKAWIPDELRDAWIAREKPVTRGEITLIANGSHFSGSPVAWRTPPKPAAGMERFYYVNGRTCGPNLLNPACAITIAKKRLRMPNMD